MIVDWDLWVLLLLFLILVVLLMMFMQFRGQIGKPPVVLFDAAGGIDVVCGHKDTIYANGIGTMDINVELANTGNCEVSLSTQTFPNFLVRDGLRNTKGAAAIRIGQGQTIFYSCKADAADDAHCSFRIKITRI